MFKQNPVNHVFTKASKSTQNGLCIGWTLDQELRVGDFEGSLPCALWQGKLLCQSLARLETKKLGLQCALVSLCLVLFHSVGDCF